ncbi:MAG TPA: phytanoyl-CoA dioxygenase family protein [Candidatus Elarobacter sp.]|nr:phytanoyl-CoA dioxygenase family protein [Candidatus Elarobacter sp.]
MLTTRTTLDDEAALWTFQRDGFVVLRGLLDIEGDIRPLQRDLAGLMARVAGIVGAAHVASEDPDAFDRGFIELVARDPRASGLVYDMAKALVPFRRLCVHDRIVSAFLALRAAQLCGAADQMCGVRIDRPDNGFRSPWHQEFPSLFRSLDGITFWTPLTPMTEEMGPMLLAAGSHRDGIHRIDAGEGTEAEMASGGYANFRIENEEAVLARHEVVAPLIAMGDVVALDFRTLHRSGVNRSQRTRWSAQMRLMSFDDPVGADLGWTGGIKSGKTVRDINALIDRANAVAKGR